MLMKATQKIDHTNFRMGFSFGAHLRAAVAAFGRFI
jgi:hypothetical protein